MNLKLKPALWLSLLLSGTALVTASEPTVRHLDQGISEDDKQKFLAVDMQSEFFPYEWLLALETPSGGKSFWDQQNVDALGMVPAGRTGLSDSILPVGLTKNVHPSPKDLVVPYLANGITFEQYGKRITYIDSGVPLPKADDGLLQGYAEPGGNPAALRLSTVGTTRAAKTYQPVKTWAAMNCLFCHSGQVNYQGTEMVVWGGPAQLNRRRFLSDLCYALVATIRDEKRFARFCDSQNAASAEEKTQLKQQLTLHTQGLLGFVARNYSPVEYGFARMDAFTMLHNEITGTMLSEPRNYRIPNAPVSYAYIWNAPKLNWYQWNGCVNQPLIRNCVEAMGAFGRTKVTSANGKPVYTSTTDIRTLRDIWTWVSEIDPPKWPEDVLGKIDPSLVKRGQAIYAREKCADCHGAKPPYPMTAPNADGHRFVKTTMTPLTDIGTDPMQATNFATRTAITGIVAPMFRNQPKTAAAQILANSGVQVMINGFEKYRLNKKQQAEWSDYAIAVPPTPEHLMGYKARDLSGIWATAPYLHNGSVPNLYQLLLPPKERVQEFRVGSRELDPRHVGFESETDSPGTLLDTTRPGNSNHGHDYGTGISDDERWALIEYLKTF